MAIQPKAGEMLVGAYLKSIEACEVVAYGQHSPVEGDQLEVDVIGVGADGGDEVVICEVATHLRGLGYGTAEKNADRVAAKFRNAARYADRAFDDETARRYQFWSPKVQPASVSTLETAASDFDDETGSELELVVNDEYAARVRDLREAAAGTSAQGNELAFRLLQILEAVQPSA